MPRVVKLDIFIAEQIGNKPVTEIPGIGQILGSKLSKAGFDTASSVLGQFLLFKMNKDYFCDWMIEICQAKPYIAETCWWSLYQWCENFL
ncbi:barrier-to-autointegration factor-like [Drosophila ficusphila]|uniref:barrier-to-autointegration factor-like n=1 Tax=Drosophila ficusphila TaxID=30025 RepID=UPI0007E80E8D|nr:barrier-to-autointegration factor-like [Drosophila ficusphila]